MISNAGDFGRREHGEQYYSNPKTPVGLITRRKRQRSHGRSFSKESFSLISHNDD
jgi:hypothetical protein